MPLIGRVPSSKDFQGSDLFSQNESWVTDVMTKISKFFKKLGLLASKVSLRTGAWHPLSQFSGCPGTRGTPTVAALDVSIISVEFEVFSASIFQIVCDHAIEVG